MVSTRRRTPLEDKTNEERVKESKEKEEKENSSDQSKVQIAANNNNENNENKDDSSNNKGKEEEKATTNQRGRGRPRKEQIFTCACANNEIKRIRLCNCGSTKCIRHCDECKNAQPKERTPYCDRTSRRVQCRPARGYFDEDLFEDNDDHVVSNLFNREGVDARTRKKLSASEVDNTVSQIVEYVEKSLKSYRHVETQSIIRSKVAKQLLSNATSTMTSNGIKNFDENEYPHVIVEPFVQPDYEVMKERDNMRNLILKFLLIENRHSVTYRTLRILISECLNDDHIKSMTIRSKKKRIVRSNDSNEEDDSSEENDSSEEDDSNEDDNEDEEDIDNNNDLLDNEKIKIHQRNLFGKRARNKAKKDYETIINTNKPLQMTKRSLQRYDQEEVDCVIKFILSEDNILLFAWNSRKIVVKETSEHIESFPSCARKQLAIDMWKNYERLPSEGRQKICQSRFFDIVKLLTINNDRVVKAVDYVKARLISEPCGVLQRIINEMVLDSKKKKEFTRDVQVTSNFLKNQYKEHLNKNDDCSTHSVSYALEKQIPIGTEIEKVFNDGEKYNGTVIRYNKAEGWYKVKYDDGDEEDLTYEEIQALESNGIEKRVCNCNACKFPHYICAELRNHITLETNKLVDSATETNEARKARLFSDRLVDAIKAINDIEHKFVLYMDHEARAINQERRIKALHQKMKEEVKTSKGVNVIAMITIDWKMKWEPYTNRETQLEHYGKRGVSWHGSYIMYFTLDTDGEVVEKRLYIHQILEGDNKQDGLTVFAMVEAILVHIKQELSFITEIWLQSDNAACYHSKDLIFGIALLGIHYDNNLRISRVIHTETQKGKGLVDAGLAKGTHKIQRYVATTKTNIIKKVATPREIVQALASNGGIQNASIMLVSVDREYQCAIKEKLKEVSKLSNSYFDRFNEIEFVPVEGNTDMHNITSWDIQFQIKCWLYSGIGPGIDFLCDLETNHFVNLDNNGKPATKPKTKIQKKESNDDDDSTTEDEIECDDDDDSVIEKNKEELEDERQNLRDFNAEQARDEKVPEPIVNSLFYNGSDCKENKLVTRVHVKQVTSFNMREVNQKQNQKEKKKDNSSNYNNVSENENGKIFHKDMLSYALRKAGSLIHSEDNAVTVLDGKDENISDYSKAVQFKVPECFIRPKGSGRRKRKGEMYGAKWMDDSCKTIIEDLFEKGAEDSNEKKGPREMYEILVTEYPERYSIPNEFEIQSYISSLFQQKKKSQSDKGERKNENEKGHTLLLEHIEYIKKAIDDGKKELDKLMPKTVLADAKKYFKREKKIHPDLEETFKSKFSSLKSAHKTKEEKERRTRVVDL